MRRTSGSLGSSMLTVPVRRTRPRGATNSSTSSVELAIAERLDGHHDRHQQRVRRALEHARGQPLAARRNRASRSASARAAPPGLTSACVRARASRQQPLRERVRSDLSQPPAAGAGALEHVFGREPEPACGLDGDAELIGLVGVRDRHRVRASGRSACSSCAAAVAPSVAGSAITTRSGCSSASSRASSRIARTVGWRDAGRVEHRHAVAADPAQRAQRARSARRRGLHEVGAEHHPQLAALGPARDRREARRQRAALAIGAEQRRAAASSCRRRRPRRPRSRRPCSAAAARPGSAARASRARPGRGRRGARAGAHERWRRRSARSSRLADAGALEALRDARACPAVGAGRHLAPLARLPRRRRRSSGARSSGRRSTCARSTGASSTGSRSSGSRSSGARAP